MLPCDSSTVQVVGRRWDSNTPVRVTALEGQNLEAILLDSVRHLRKNGQYSREFARRSLKYCRCRVNGFEVKREDWATAYPVKGDRVEFFLAPKGGGGGGGKNILGTILQAIVVIVAAVATFWAGGLGGWAAAAAYAGIAAFTFGSTMLIGALFPPAAPNLGGIQTDSLKNSPTYSISGSRNGLNLDGFVPLILGKHRITPPLAAKSWTVWEGEVQYFHMCVCWGHSNIEVSDMRIEDTPLENFKDLEHVFHAATTGDDLKLFAKSYDERSVGAQLKQASGWTTRTIGEGEDISLDIAFNGLCRIDEETGKNKWHSVTIEARCRIVGTEDWYGMGQGFTLTAATFPNVAWDWQPDRVWDNDSGYDGEWVWPPREYYTTYFSATANGIVASTGGWHGEALWSIRAGVLTNHRPGYLSGCDASYNSSTRTVSITAGSNRGNPVFSFGSDTTKQVVRNIRKNNNPLGIYEVSIRRATGDSSSTYIRDECSWQTSRAIKNRPAFATPIPICVSELRIKATEQLSSYIENLNGLAESVLPDWDGKEWTPKKTSNNASIIRYLLTSRAALNSPYSEAKLDMQTFIDFHEHCEKNKYSFNFVCDSETKAWHRLMQVAAAGRATISLDNDGLYGIVMDTQGKEPMQMFTPRNSWGFKLNRTFADLPHALRVSFVNAEQNYEKCEDFVYADGYTSENATDIIEFDFPGITNWETNWKFGRYHIAQLLHRPYTMTISTDWEWRMCRRGQIVGVAHDVLMNVFGTARVQRLAFEIDGKIKLVGREQDFPLGEDELPLIPVGVQLDDSIVYDDPAPARYGIAIRNGKGSPVVYEIVPEYGEESDVIIFKNPLCLAIVPKLQDLCSVSILGDEYLEALVSSIVPGENMSAEITLIPYAIDEILAADSGEIPPYKPPIHLDVIGNNKLKAPTITNIRSDESVLIRQDGRTVVRIGVWWQLESTDAQNIVVQMMASTASDQKNASVSATDENFVAVQDVTEGEVYTVRIRIVDRIGRTSPWSVPVLHKVIGRTTPPPAPSRVTLSGSVVSIEQRNRPLDLVGHEVWMAFDAGDTFGMSLKLSNPYTVNGLFDVSPWAGWARRIFVRSIDELGLTSEPVSVVINLGDVYVKNVLFTRSERALGWSGEIENGYVLGRTLYADENTSLWPQDNTHPLWIYDDASPLCPSGAGSILRYTWLVEVPTAYAGAEISVLPQILAGKLQSIEMRLFIDAPLWLQDDKTPLWPQDDNSPLWSQPIAGQWQVMPEKYAASGGETIHFRVTFSQEIPAQIADISTVFDVQDKEWAVHNLDIHVGGTRSPVPAAYFRAITNSTFGLQYFEGSTATNVARIRNSEIIGLDGYVSEGPIIMGLDSNQQSTSANTDIILKGY